MFPVGQVEHEGKALVASLEGCRADEHRHPAAVFPQVLFFEGLAAPSRPQLGHRALARAKPFGGGQLCPPDPSEARSSRSYPTVSRKASLASRLWPSESVL